LLFERADFFYIFALVLETSVKLSFENMNNFDRKIPYNDLPLLPPETDIETKNIFRKTISAGRALAQPSGALQNSPNQALI
jgi:hypothetical protein